MMLAAGGTNGDELLGCLMLMVVVGLSTVAGMNSETFMLCNRIVLTSCCLGQLHMWLA